MHRRSLPEMTPVPILYDPDCGFCRVSLAAILRLDARHRLRPVPLGSDEADLLLRGLPDEERMASWHLVLPDGTVRSAGAAFPPLFELLPRGGRLARLSGRFPRASERTYRWVADHRSILGGPLPAGIKRWADAVISESERDGR
jgi:predicted DCC family thiol-disulfide oxidoreductase YuxK